MLWLRRLPLVLGLGLIACGSKPPTEPAQSPEGSGPLTVERYLPLQHNTVFSYETFVQETNEHGIAVIEVSRPRSTLAELRIAGQVKKRYYIYPDGVLSPGGGYWLKSPLAEDAEWQGDDGKVKVTAINEAIKVPAGDFTGCLRTVEKSTTNSSSRTQTTVFCPGVGMTWYEVEGQVNGQAIMQRLSLKSFGPRFVAGLP